MEQKFTVELTINWNLEISNTFTKQKDPLLYKSSFLKQFDEDIQNIKNVDINTVQEDIIQGTVTVVQEQVFNNPDKTAKECVEDALEDPYFQDRSSVFKSFDIKWVRVIEERKETVIDTDTPFEQP